MARKPCCSKEAVKKGAWSFLEDQILSNFIQRHGEGNWRNLPRQAGLKRCGKSCRLRWVNYLKPGIKRGEIAEDEEDLIIRLHNLLGNRWSLIAGRLPGRTDNEIKNYWNSHLKKRTKGRKNKHPDTHSKANKINDETTPKSVVVRAKAVRFNGEVVKIPRVTNENDNSIAISTPKSGILSSSSSCSLLEDLVLDNIGKDLELDNLDITDSLHWKLDFSYLGLEEMNFGLDQVHGFNEEYTWP